MTTQPTYPVHSAGDVPGLPAVPGANQHNRGRKPFVNRRKRRREDPSHDSSDEEPTVEAPQESTDETEKPDGHVDCLA